MDRRLLQRSTYFFVKIRLVIDEHNNTLVVYVITVERSQLFVLELLTFGFGWCSTL